LRLKTNFLAIEGRFATLLLSAVWKEFRSLQRLACAPETGLWEAKVVPNGVVGGSGTSPGKRLVEIRTADTGRRFWAYVATMPLTLLTVASLVIARQAQGTLKVSG
jgi:hypothetical protein